MQKTYIQRKCEALVKERLEHNPAVALLGARQVGKSTLAKEMAKHYPHALYLDLEKTSDRSQIEADVELFLRQNSKRLICLDEIQLLPEIFSTLRSHIDVQGRNAQFLILGSASRDLIRQSSESLAGRIAHIEMTPFHFSEIHHFVPLMDHWFKGGYPKSLLQKEIGESVNWRADYIKTFLERDLPQLGFSIPASTLERFWKMLAHSHGQIVNYTNLGKSLGVSHHTVKSYIDILEQTFIVRILRPYYTNSAKRLVKSPKVYLRDSGLLHTLLGIDGLNPLLGHPIAGNSFESYVIENILMHAPRWESSFYRDSSGNEVDLVLEKGGQKVAIEIKLSTSPKLEKGFWNAIKFLRPDQSWVIAQVDSPYSFKQNVQVADLDHFLREGPFLKY